MCAECYLHDHPFLQYTGSGETAPGQGAGYAEYARHEVLQMAGRAGRPQFDTEASMRASGSGGSALAWGNRLLLPHISSSMQSYACCLLHLADASSSQCSIALFKPANALARPLPLPDTWPIPQGVAVIMTQRSTAGRYSKLAAGQEEVESCLLDSVAEHLNGGDGPREGHARQCVKIAC
jgi:hypothetical protein